jgi:hypothetical protein
VRWVDGTRPGRRGCDEDEREGRKIIGAQELPIDVWIDGDGYVRRIDEKFTLTAKGKTEHMSAVITIPELGDFTIQPPTEGVADMTDEITATA